MSIDFRRQTKGYYSTWDGRFSIIRTEDAKGWRAYDVERINGLDTEGLVGTYVTLDEAKRVLSRIHDRERAEQNRVQAEQQVAAREAKQVAEAQERADRQNNGPSLYNHDVMVDVRITKQEAIAFCSRLLGQITADGDEVQIVIRTSHKWNPGDVWERLVDLQPGWSGFDTAHGRIHDSAIEACDPIVKA